MKIRAMEETTGPETVLWLRHEDVVAWLREEAQRRTDPMSRGSLNRAAKQIDNGLALL